MTGLQKRNATTAIAAAKQESEEEEAREVRKTSGRMVRPMRKGAEELAEARKSSSGKLPSPGSGVTSPSTPTPSPANG